MFGLDLFHSLIYKLCITGKPQWLLFPCFDVPSLRARGMNWRKGGLEVSGLECLFRVLF